MAGLAGAATVFGVNSYRETVRTAERRLEGRSRTIQTNQGQLEYAVAGSGVPLLMVHGTGGGFDQALTFTESLADHGIRIIAPSRFGYLQSDFPRDPSSERQADAFVELLDHLGIDKVAVAGGSAGALSAAHFALRHPERCSALILIVPAANVRGRDPVQMSPGQAYAVKRLTTSNFLYWLAIRVARDRMIATLLATDPAVVHKAPPPEQRRAIRILEEIMPIERRSRGMANDAHLAGHPARIDFAKIGVPTLIISAKDDRFGTATTARDIAAAMPAARLLIFDDGGHIWVGHDQQLWNEVSDFLRKAASGAVHRNSVKELSS